ncbi:hypothetical protein Tco_1020541 [Tanacetum coccineum]
MLETVRGTNNKTRDRTLGGLTLLARCNKCKKLDHLARDYRSSGPNDNNNNRGNSGTTQNAVTNVMGPAIMYMSCGVPRGHGVKEGETVAGGEGGEDIAGEWKSRGGLGSVQCHRRSVG